MAGSTRIYSLTTDKGNSQMKTFKTYTRFGFLITHSAGPDAPWRGWREDGTSFRADTVRGAFEMARNHKGK